MSVLAGSCEERWQSPPMLRLQGETAQRVPPIGVFVDCLTGSFASTFGEGGCGGAGRTLLAQALLRLGRHRDGVGLMSKFETRFAPDEDADRIRSAFYGFVERHAPEVDGPAHIRTEIDSKGMQLTVCLWSAEAIDAFLGDLALRRPLPQ